MAQVFVDMLEVLHYLAFDDAAFLSIFKQMGHTMKLSRVSAFIC